MHLPERVKKNLDRQYQLLKAEYEYEFDTEFEKNRHFYRLSSRTVWSVWKARTLRTSEI